MARHEPNRKSLAVALVAAFLAVTLLVGALAILFGGQVRQKAQQLAQENAMPAVSEPSGSQEGTSSQPQEGSGPEQEAPEASSQPQQEPEEPAPVGRISSLAGRPAGRRSPPSWTGRWKTPRPIP